jgi:hypothetical protein
MEVLSVYDFDRHFQIARATTFKLDWIVPGMFGWYVPEKSGNVQQCIEIMDQNSRALESYMRAAPPPGIEFSCIIWSQGSFIGVEAHHQLLKPKHLMLRHFKYAGINCTQQAQEGYCASAECEFWRSIAGSSTDGLTHMLHDHAMVAMTRAILSFSVGTSNVELSWLDGLPPADATTLCCCLTSSQYPATARVLVAEVFEQQGRHADAIRFAQTDLQDYHNRNMSSKVRAGRVLGRCHAAVGQHMLSVSAFEAAIDLARLGGLLLSEALSVRGRAAAGRNGMGGAGIHWDKKTGEQRLTEVMGRMQGPREALERVLVLPR